MITITNYPKNNQYLNFEARFRLKKSNKFIGKPLLRTVSTAWSSGFSTAGIMSRLNILYHIFSS